MDLTDTFFNWPVFKGAFPLLLEGLGVTVLLGLVSIVAGLVSGLLMALLRLYGPAPLRMVARVYIDVFRSIPLLVLLVLVYYALPFVGVRFSSFTAAALALSSWAVASGRSRCNASSRLRRTSRSAAAAPSPPTSDPSTSSAGRTSRPRRRPS